MHAKERRETLVHLLTQHKFLSIRELAESLSVSEMTVRRDMELLQDGGLVERLHGGGQVVRSAHEPEFSVKRQLQQEEKQAIAQVAATLVEPHMTVSFSAGTTTWMVAKALQGITGLTIITNSTNIALELSQQSTNDIILSGGHFRTPSDALVGPIAESAVKRLRSDLLFLGVHGADLDAGMMTPNVLEASIDRVMMNQAQRVALVIDSSKWGVHALAQIASIDEVDILITDDGRGSEPIIENARLRGLEVFVATL